MTERNETVVRAAEATDSAAIAKIYNHYIAQTVVTFEVDEVSADEMLRRMERVQSDSLPWLVAQIRGDVVGYAYAATWHSRYAYRFAAETTVYLDHQCGGRGIGSSLYEVLLDQLAERGMHTAIGGIAIPNDASIALHEKFGYRKTAHYKEVGYKFDRLIVIDHDRRLRDRSTPSKTGRTGVQTHKRYIREHPPSPSAALHQVRPEHACRSPIAPEVGSRSPATGRRG